MRCSTRAFLRMPEGREMSLSKVLLVDDDEVVRLTLGAMMREQGFDITTAANVSEAYKLRNL